MDILVVDDEGEMAALISRGLTTEGHSVFTATNGLEGLAYCLHHHVDVAVLDVMMPGMTGFELCRWLKKNDPRIAVILLTARDAVDDRVRGLDDGADDYITKPFAMAELCARIRAIARRDALSAPEHLAFGSIELDTAGRDARINGTLLSLSRTEFDVLRALVTAQGEVVTRRALLTDIWGSEHHIDPNVLDQYVSYVRRKLAATGTDTHIETVRGVGYRISTPSETS